MVIYNLLNQKNKKYSTLNQYFLSLLVDKDFHGVSYGMMVFIILLSVESNLKLIEYIYIFKFFYLKNNNLTLL